MKIVAIANQKGGVGKTTTAVNLGCALAEAGLRVLIIDLDPQGNATSSFGLQELEGESLYEPLLGTAAIADKIVPTRVERVFVVPADLDLAGAEVEIARLDNHLTRLAETLAPLRADNTFDFIFLDCPPSLGILMTNALAAADELLTPIQCEFFALEGLVKIVRIIEQVRDSGANDRLEIGGIVMTMFDSRTNLSVQVVADVRAHFGERVYETVIPRTVRLSEAPSFGKSILEHDPSGACGHLLECDIGMVVARPLFAHANEVQLRRVRTVGGWQQRHRLVVHHADPGAIERQAHVVGDVTLLSSVLVHQRVIVIAQHSVRRDAGVDDRLEDLEHLHHLRVHVAVRLVHEIAGNEHERGMNLDHLPHETPRGVLVRPPHANLKIGEHRDLLPFPFGGQIRNRRILIVAIHESWLDRGSVQNHGRQYFDEEPHLRE